MNSPRVSRSTERYLPSFIVLVPVVGVLLVAALVSISFINSQQEFMALESELVSRNVMEQSRADIKREVSVAIRRLSDDYQLARKNMRARLRAQTRALAHVIHAIHRDADLPGNHDHDVIRGLAEGKDINDVAVFSIEPDNSLRPTAVSGDDADRIRQTPEAVAGLLNFLGYRDEGYVFVPDVLNGADALMYLVRLEGGKQVVASIVNLSLFEERLKKRSLAMLAQVRYGADGYMFVYRADGVYLMNPFDPGLAGQNLRDIPDGNGKPLWREFMQVGESHEGRFISYRWTRPGRARVEEKVTYAQLYPRWNWVIASGVYVEDQLQAAAAEQSALHERANKATGQAIMIAVAMIALTVIVTLLMARNTSRLLGRYQTHMKQQNRELNALNSQLEQRILERTRELQEKNERLRQLSSTDPLTGLCNRLRLDHFFEKALAGASRYNRPFSVILLDLDHFKSINDTWGHATGDEVLKQVSALLSQELREADVPGRWGGEEFLIILPETTLSQAMSVAEKLRAAIEALDIVPVEVTTSSFGVSCYRDGDTIEAMMARADTALYGAKKAGRNRVEAG